MLDQNEFITKTIATMLEHHDQKPLIEKDWVTCNGGFPAFRMFYAPPTTEGKVGVLQTQTYLAQDVVIEELFAAVGEDEASAIRNGLSGYAGAMLNPVMAAYGKNPIQNQFTRETWKGVEDTELSFYFSNVVARMSQGVKITLPKEWPGVLTKQIRETELPQKLNWLSIFITKNLDEPMALAARLNNEDWPEGTALTKALDWPASTGFYSARIFALIVKADKSNS